MLNKPQSNISIDELLRIILNYFKDIKRFDEHEGDYSHIVKRIETSAEAVLFVAEIADHGTRYGHGEGQADKFGDLAFINEYPEEFARFLWLYEKYIGKTDTIDVDLLKYYRKTDIIDVDLLKYTDKIDI